MFESLPVVGAPDLHFLERFLVLLEGGDDLPETANLP